MKAVIKGIWSDAIDESLEEFVPPNPECFGFCLNLRIGLESECGTNDFSILVCTPNWLEVSLRYEWNRSEWGRHMLIVLEYDFDLIEEKISSYVSGCTGKDFGEIAQKISRIAAWEFEDYQNK